MSATLVTSAHFYNVIIVCLYTCKVFFPFLTTQIYKEKIKKRQIKYNQDAK